MLICICLAFTNLICFFFFLQVYYYSARTREAAWSKPENARIVTQTEWEVFQTSQVQAQVGLVPAVTGGNSAPAQTALIPGIFVVVVFLDEELHRTIKQFLN